VRGEDLVRLSPQEQRVGLVRPVDHQPSDAFVEGANQPATVLESTVAVLIRPAWALHHTVHGEERPYD
jgi:hypothetical protein